MNVEMNASFFFSLFFIIPIFLLIFLLLVEEREKEKYVEGKLNEELLRIKHKFKHKIGKLENLKNEDQEHFKNLEFLERNYFKLTKNIFVHLSLIFWLFTPSSMNVKKNKYNCSKNNYLQAYERELSALITFGILERNKLIRKIFAFRFSRILKAVEIDALAEDYSKTRQDMKNLYQIKPNFLNCYKRNIAFSIF